MRAKVIPFKIHHKDDLEDDLNKFLAQTGPSRIEHIVPLVHDTDGTLVIFYSEPDRKLKPVICTQCRKNPPLDGLKVCEGCRDYQRDYRKKRKQEKKVTYP